MVWQPAEGGEALSAQEYATPAADSDNGAAPAGEPAPAPPEEAPA
jgi:hypothetical protein